MAKGGACVVKGGMCGKGVCMAKGGMHDKGACMVGECAWWGACMAGGVCGRRDGHCNGRYTSYWNAFLLKFNFTKPFYVAN